MIIFQLNNLEVTFELYLSYRVICQLNGRFCFVLLILIKKKLKKCVWTLCTIENFGEDGENISKMEKFHDV